MGFTAVCKSSYLGEGEWLPFSVDGEAIMLVWPEGDRPHAYQGLCPHESVGLSDGIFNGRVIVCTAHGWEFDARTGRSLSPQDWALEEYPLRVADGYIEVDMECVLE